MSVMSYFPTSFPFVTDCLQFGNKLSTNCLQIVYKLFTNNLGKLSVMSCLSSQQEGLAESAAAGGGIGGGGGN